MAIDSTRICNMALSAIGTRSQIASLSEVSTEAEQCNLHYEPTVRELLRLYNWDWARRQISLTVYKAAQGTPENPAGATPVPPLPWLYSYAWPDNCVKLRQILPFAPPTDTVTGVPLTSVGSVLQPVQLLPKPVPFRVAGDVDSNNNPLKVILCNQRQAQALYTGLVLDPNIWDDLMVRAVIGRLAALLVIPCSGDKTLANMAVRRGAEAEEQAKAADGNQNVMVVDRAAEWHQDRGWPDSEQTMLSGVD